MIHAPTTIHVVHVLFRISPSHFRSITVAELKANPPSDIFSLRFNVLVVKRDTDFSSFNATAGPKVSRLKITVADQSGWIKCYVSDPNLDTYRGLCQGCQDTLVYINNGEGGGH